MRPGGATHMANEVENAGKHAAAPPEARRPGSSKPSDRKLGAMKRGSDASTAAPPNKRAATKPADEPTAATNLQAAWRGFRVRSTGLATQSRAHTQSGQSTAKARRSADVISLVRTPEYRQVSRPLVPPPSTRALV